MKKLHIILACFLCLSLSCHGHSRFYNIPTIGKLTLSITQSRLKAVLSFIGRHKTATALLATTAILGTCYWQRKRLRDTTGRGLRPCSQIKKTSLTQMEL